MSEVRGCRGHQGHKPLWDCKARPLCSVSMSVFNSRSDSSLAERASAPLRNRSSSRVWLPGPLPRSDLCDLLELSHPPGGCVHCVGEEIKAQRVGSCPAFTLLGSRGAGLNPGPPLSGPASYLLLESDPCFPGVICDVGQLSLSQTGRTYMRSHIKSVYELSGAVQILAIGSESE